MVCFQHRPSHHHLPQVALVIFAGTGLDMQRMKILRLTVELYMMLTNRNMNQWHTDATIEKLKKKLQLWTVLLERMLGSWVGTRHATDMNMPKFHDIQHIIDMIKIRGIAQYHSTEG